MHVATMLHIFFKKFEGAGGLPSLLLLWNLAADSGSCRMSGGGDSGGGGGGGGGGAQGDSKRNGGASPMREKKKSAVGSPAGTFLTGGHGAAGNSQQ